MTPSFGHDPSDVATKADLADLRSDMRADIAEWRDAISADIAALRWETRQRFERVEDGLGAVNQRVDRLFHTLLAGFFAVAATMIGVIIAIL